MTDCRLDLRCKCLRYRSHSSSVSRILLPLRRSSTVSRSGAMSTGTSPRRLCNSLQLASSNTDKTSSAPCVMLMMNGPMALSPYLRLQKATAWKTASVLRAVTLCVSEKESRDSIASTIRVNRSSGVQLSQPSSPSNSPTTWRCTSASWRTSSVRK